MNVSTAAVIISAAAAFGLASYYIGNTGWKYFISRINFINIKLYWLIFILLSLTCLLQLVPDNYLPSYIDMLLRRIGAYWMAILLYSFVFFLLADTIGIFIAKRNSKRHFFIKSRISNTALHNTALLFIIIIITYGILRAYYPAATQYSIDIKKQPSTMSKLHIVMVSDIHIGSIIAGKNLLKMINEINALKPDVIVICGDIIDSRSTEFKNQKADKILKKLKAVYGVYAVPGNHDYYDSSDVESKFECYRNSNIILLRDEYVKIADEFYIVGRDDASCTAVTKKRRKSIDELVKNLDHSLPIIVLDHQPLDVDAEQENGVDLQLSGHTHGGQTFLSSVFSKHEYDQLVYGEFEQNNLNVIVSSGFGTWGIPLRTGSRAEIVDINVNFR